MSHIYHIDKFFVSSAAIIFLFPSQKLIRKYSSKSFEIYPTTEIIICRTNILVERATSVKTLAQIQSNHKYHNTRKALVGISDNGIQLLFHLPGPLNLGKCPGLLEKLKLGDNIKVDREFGTANILPSGLTLNIPPLKEGRNQLNPEKTDETTRIAAVTKNVEHAIGKIKNYHILDRNSPLSMTPLLNQEFTVRSYLTDFLTPFVPPDEADTS